MNTTTIKINIIILILFFLNLKTDIVISIKSMNIFFKIITIVYISFVIEVIH